MTKLVELVQVLLRREPESTFCSYLDYEARRGIFTCSHPKAPLQFPFWSAVWSDEPCVPEDRELCPFCDELEQNQSGTYTDSSN